MLSFNNHLVYVTFICASFCFVWSTQDKLHARIPKPMVLELREQAQKCSKETGVPATHLRKIMEKSLPLDTPNKNFYFCVFNETGYIDEHQHYKREKLVSIEVLDGTIDDYLNVIDECNKIVKEDIYDTLIAVGNCVHERYSFSVAT